MTDSMLLTIAQTASDQLMSGGVSPAQAPAGTTAPGTTPATPGGPPPGGGMMGLLIPLTLFMVVLIFFQIMGQRREKKRREQLMSALKRGDKVLTIGGQIGIVEQVRDHEVVLRTDEHSNAKARFTKAAIQQVLESGPASPGEPPSVEVKAGADKLVASR